MSEINRDSWTTAERYIAGRLDRMETELRDQGDKLYQIHGEVSGLRARSSIFGVFGGLIVALAARFGMHT